MDIKLSKEDKEENSVRHDDPGVDLGVAAVDEERLEGVDDEDDELDHLELGEVLLPPEVLLDLRPEGGQEVVEVHHNVNAAVEETAKGGVASADESAHGSKLETFDKAVSDPPPPIVVPGTEPDEDRQPPVMDHVEGGEVAELLSEDEEEGVEKVDELGEVVPPGFEKNCTFKRL